MISSHFSTSTLLVAFALGACSHSDAAGDARRKAPEASPRVANRIAIAVTGDGFVPSHARVHVGQPVTLVVTRKVERTCATDIVIKDYGVNKPLPQNQPVEVTFTPTTPGPIRYACAMNMVAGELVAE
jgi:plastocyanin domain-containing protein